MSADTLPPPQPPKCLTRSYLSRGVKGGTIICAEVLDLAEHRRRLADPDSYRPEKCRNCGHHKNHAHCFRERVLRPADRREPCLIVMIRLFCCASCRAVVTVLPAFIARHLWRAWETVERVLGAKQKAPPATRQRWLARLDSDASQLLRLLAASFQGEVVEALLRSRPSTRRAFIAVLQPFLGTGSSLFASLSAWIQRLEPGLRLM